MMIIFYLLIIFLGFYLRIKPRLKNPYYGTDAWYFLLAAGKFREQRALPFRIPYYVLDEEEQYYPPGFFVLLGSLPQKFLKKFFPTINIHFFWNINIALHFFLAEIR